MHGGRPESAAGPDTPPHEDPGYIDAHKLGFALGHDELGDRLIPKLQALVGDASFAGKVRIEDLQLTPAALADAVPPSGSTDFHVQFEVVHEIGDDGSWNLSSIAMDEVKLPDLCNVEVPPPGEDAE